jgi:DNA-binding response OmpR family regulator
LKIGYIQRYEKHRRDVSKNKDRILFVDDDAELREIVRDQLSSAGYQVDEAADGTHAIEKIPTGDYDLLLLDITLPGKTGIDVLKFVKDKSIPCRVIMLTGMAGLSLAFQSLKLGADDYITKPYNADYLLSSIKRVLAL